MAYSYINYHGDGENTGPFSVPFPYIFRSHVHVYLNGVEVPDESIEWTSNSTINITPAPPEGVIIHICRLTNREARMVDYQDGSMLEEGTLNLDSTQLFYLMQEAYDLLIKAGDVDNAVFQDRQAVLDALIGNLDRTMLTQDLVSRIEYADRWYEADEIIESMSDYVEPVYFQTPLQWGIAQIGVNTDNISALVTSLDGAWSEINVQAGLITQISTDVEGNAGMIALLSDEYYVKLDAHGAVSGFGLYNDPDGSSYFLVNADKFAVIKSDGTGTVKVPFVVDGTTGTVGINGGLVVTGTITAGAMNIPYLSSIAANLGTITAGTIRSTNWGTSAGCEILLNAGTFRFGGSSNPALEWDGTDITLSTGGDITIEDGGNLRINVGGDLILDGDSSNPGRVFFDGSSYDCQLFANSLGTTFNIDMLTPGVASCIINDFKNFWVYTNAAASMRAYKDSTEHAEVYIQSTDSGGSYPMVSLTVHDNSAYNTVNLYGSSFPGGRCFTASVDNVLKSGWASGRWTAVYAVNGTIQTSDERDKERISNLDLGLDFILKLRPVNYSWIGQAEVRQGFIAQEVEDALDGKPLSALDYCPVSDRYGLNYAEFVAPIIKAIQDLHAEVQSLKEKINV